MIFSLNEIEVTAKKAARGAGYSWGVSEEAGKAVRLLCANSIDGVALLADLLDAGLANGSALALSADGRRLSADGALCSLTAGAYFSDAAALLEGHAFEAKELMTPSLIIPFASNIARLQRSVVTIELDGVPVVRTDGNSVAVLAAMPSKAAQLRLVAGGEMGTCQPVAQTATPDMKSWQKLQDYAHKTYAPATEESRLLGAGAGLSDND